MRTLAELEERLSRPRRELIEDVARLSGDILVLGAGGKLGPSLVRLALRAGAGVTAVSRFSEPRLADALADEGAKVIHADVADEAALAALPDADNVIFLVGAKFGTSGRESATWATNAYLPGRVAARFAGSRLVALSTGNVYPLVPVTSAGCTEDTPPDPVGEYAMSCLGRERVIEHLSRRDGTPTVFVRLNYAAEPRYGVLTDVVQAILAGEPVDLTMGHANVVWQGYANEVILRSLHLASNPPVVLNLTGPELVSIRHVAIALGDRLGRAPVLTGTEAATALLSNAERCHQRFGYPDVPLGQLLDWIGEWTAAALPTHGKPTHFQQRDGRF